MIYPTYICSYPTFQNCIKNGRLGALCSWWITFHSNYLANTESLVILCIYFLICKQMGRWLFMLFFFLSYQNQTNQVGNCSLTSNAQNNTLTFKTIQSCNWQLVSISHHLFFSVDTNTFLSYNNITLKNVKKCYFYYKTRKYKLWYTSKMTLGD